MSDEKSVRESGDALTAKCSEWKKIKRAKCDICPRSAIWEHPAGGLRCGMCQRPERADLSESVDR